MNKGPQGKQQEKPDHTSLPLLEAEEDDRGRGNFRQRL